MACLLTQRFFRLVLPAVALLLTSVLTAGSARAQICLRYTFQPDCLRSANHPGVCSPVLYLPDSTDPTKDSKSIDRLDLGPQIAVWLESADGATFVDTLMVTNQVAARGIGNRPGLSNFVSSPKFPYGKRQMALPIWAHSQGHLYPTVVFQDVDTAGNHGACSGEGRIGFHEACSSPEPYYCRPLMGVEIVDAITCPSALFNSSKGHFDMTLPPSYYPPRNDLGSSAGNFVSRDCDIVNDSITGCTVDSETYMAVNGLDAVAQATPAYGTPYTATWEIPAALAAGDYAVMVEVNKEFDSNSYHNGTNHPSVQDAGLASYGLSGNFGQPSVVYKVPIHLDGTVDVSATTDQIQGYSCGPPLPATPSTCDWTGSTGAIMPRDTTITTDAAGSGEGRLMEISGPAGMGRVQVSVENCSCDPQPPAPGMVSNLSVDPTQVTAVSAVVHFNNAGANGSAVSGYEIRYAATDATTLTPDEFSQATRVDMPVKPAQPNTEALQVLENLKPSTHYVVGIRSQGPCNGQSDVAMVAFMTPSQQFTKLSGCFVATAAYGSEMEPQVAALRALRDTVRPQSGLVAAVVDLYYRSGPAAAAVISRSDTARALARRLLAPAAELAEAAVHARAAMTAQQAGTLLTPLSAHMLITR
jgi:hypothetical protein